MVDEHMDNRDETRRRSAALFGNEKTVEVVVALDEEGSATAQMIAARTGITHSLVRDVLLRLTAGGAVRPLPRLGGSRSPQYYQPVNGDLWAALASTAQAIIKASERSHSNRTEPTSRKSE
jgi:ribosomal protein S25